MSSDHHTPFPLKTELTSANLNAPLAELDAAIKVALDKLDDLPPLETDPATRTLTADATVSLDWSYGQPVMEITMDQATAFEPGTNWPANNSVHENILSIDRTEANLYTPDFSAFDREVGGMYPSDARYFEIVFEVIRGEKVLTWLPGRNA